MSRKRKGSDDKAAKARRKRAAKVNRQQKAANIRAKYGPSGKPSPVIVKRLEMDGTTEVVEVVDQSRFAPRRRRSR